MTYSNVWRESINNLLNSNSTIDTDDTDAKYWVANVLKTAPNNYRHLAEKTTESVCNEVQEEITKSVFNSEFDENVVNKIRNALTGYRLIRSMDELRRGGYIRWFSDSETPKVKLTTGGFLSNIVSESTGIHLTWRSTNRRKVGCIQYNRCVIFQRITHDEQLILSFHDMEKERISSIAAALEHSDSSDSDSDYSDESSESDESETDEYSA
jgi:hypothetical protein